MTNGHQSPLRAYKHGWFAQVCMPSCKAIPSLQLLHTRSVTTTEWPMAISRRGVLRSTVGLLRYASRQSCLATPSLHCCSGKHAATTRRWAGGNTVNAATTASAEKRLRGSDVDFAAECESWEGSRSNGFFRSVPSGNSFIMQ